VTGTDLEFEAVTSASGAWGTDFLGSFPFSLAENHDGSQGEAEGFSGPAQPRIVFALPAPNRRDQPTKSTERTTSALNPSGCP
jgi:hypothetical protein